MGDDDGIKKFESRDKLAVTPEAREAMRRVVEGSGLHLFREAVANTNITKSLAALRDLKVPPPVTIDRELVESLGAGFEYQADLAAAPARMAGFLEELLGATMTYAEAVEKREHHNTRRARLGLFLAGAALIVAIATLVVTIID